MAKIGCFVTCLSLKLQRKDIVMAQQTEFVVKFTKKCNIGEHFRFCHVWVTWWRCTISQQHMTGELIFVILLNLIIQMKKFLWYSNHLSFTHSLVRTGQKNFHLRSNGNLLSHQSSYMTSHSAGCSFIDGYPPSPVTKIVSLFLLLGLEGYSLADCASNSSVLAIQKLKPSIYALCNQPFWWL